MSKLTPILLLSIITTLAFCAVIAILWVSSSGIGTTPDSVVFIGVANNIIEGYGLSFLGDKLTAFPPVYPLFLTIGSIFKLNTLEWSRWLNGILFALTGVLVGIIVYISTKKSVVATLFSVVFFFVNAAMLHVYSLAISEIPFLFLTLVAFLLLVFYIQSKSIWILILSALFAGIALLTRYVGITLLPVLVLAILLHDSRPWEKKMMHVVLATSIIILPLLIWFIRNLIVASTTTNRGLGLHLIQISHLKSMLVTIYDFFNPISMDPSLKFLQLVIGSMILVGISIFIHRKGSIQIQYPSKSNSTLFISAIFLFAYISFLIFSKSFLEAQLPFNFRILHPALVVLLIFLFVLVWSFSSYQKTYTSIAALLSLMVIFVFVNFDKSISDAKILHNRSFGYLNQKWVKSEGINFIGRLPDNVRVYTNGQDAVYLLTEKEVGTIPQKIDPSSMRPNISYENEIENIVEEVLNDQALIVYLDNIDWRWYFPKKEELQKKFMLPTLLELDDAVVFGSLADPFIPIP